MAHKDKKKKGPYKHGGVVGTSEYSKSAYKHGGVVGTADYSKKYQDGGIVKRKGYSDGKGSRLSYKNSADHSYDGKEYGGRKGWGDKEGSKISYNQRGGSAQNSHQFKKRKGYSDSNYEDGGIVSDAKRSALMGLKSQMMEIGGNSLFDSLDNPNAYEDGGIVESHDEHDENDSEESRLDFEDLSREELIRLLKK